MRGLMVLDVNPYLRWTCQGEQVMALKLQGRLTGKLSKAKKRAQGERMRLRDQFWTRIGVRN